MPERLTAAQYSKRYGVDKDETYRRARVAVAGGRDPNGGTWERVDKWRLYYTPEGSPEISDSESSARAPQTPAAADSRSDEISGRIQEEHAEMEDTKANKTDADLSGIRSASWDDIASEVDVGADSGRSGPFATVDGEPVSLVEIIDAIPGLSADDFHIPQRVREIDVPYGEWFLFFLAVGCAVWALFCIWRDWRTPEVGENDADARGQRALAVARDIPGSTVPDDTGRQGVKYVNGMPQYGEAPDDQDG